MESEVPAVAAARLVRRPPCCPQEAAERVIIQADQITAVMVGQAEIGAIPGPRDRPAIILPEPRAALLDHTKRVCHQPQQIGWLPEPA